MPIVAAVESLDIYPDPMATEMSHVGRTDSHAFERRFAAL
jgi:hypothetical protein